MKNDLFQVLVRRRGEKNLSILRKHSAFFMVQLSHPYMTTGKKHNFEYTDFVIKVMSLVFNMLSRFVIAFLPRS